MNTKPTTPLMRRKIMRIRATGLMLKLASTGTKKLQMPRSNRATPNVSPCAVVLSMVGNSSCKRSSDAEEADQGDGRHRVEGEDEQLT
jgi:hypothetical protein